jgi:hypothetical protein
VKVGTSLSRCVMDIYEGKVKLGDVLVVVARTDFDPEDDEHWSGIWQGYRHSGTWSNLEWAHLGDEAEAGVRKICVDLKQMGKLHQPRQFGAHPQRLNEYWYEVVLPREAHNDNPVVKQAFEQYQILAGLVNGHSV